jgi:hypothetical protein
VLEASEIPRSYWIHVKSIGNCEELQVYTLGILRYKGLKFNTLTDPGYMAYSGGKVCIAPVKVRGIESRSCGTSLQDMAALQTVFFFLFKRTSTIKCSFGPITGQ